MQEYITKYALSEQSGHVFTEVVALHPLYIDSLKVRIITGKLSQIQESKSCTPQLSTGGHEHSQVLDCPHESNFGCSS